MGTAITRLARLAALAVFISAPVAAALPLVAGSAQAAEKHVSGDLGRAVRNSSFGDVLVLAPGRYEVTDLAIPHDLTLIGDGEVILYSRQPVAKGLLVPAGGTDITVRGLIFEGAVSPDLNGAGIRFEGTRLTVEDCIFRDNENGILATGDMNGSLHVTRSAFLRNGHGDGYSHGLYQYAGVQLDVTESRFLGTKEGHHVKTLASGVNVSSNVFDDQDGETSYVVDATGGGTVIVRDNTIYRRASASQRNIVNYDTTRRGSQGSLEITGNRIITEKRFINLLRNPEKAPAVISDNEETFERRIEREPEAPRLNLMRPVSSPAASTAAAAPAADMSIAFRRLSRNGGYVTYGEVFAPGVVRKGTGLSVRAGDDILPTQMNVKTRHDDGSVRHAIFTVAVPEGRGEVAGRYELDPRMTEGGVWSGTAFEGVTVELAGVIGEHRIDAAAALADADTWISGPLLEERMAVVLAGPLLDVRLDGRQYQDGTGRLRLSFDNLKTFADARRDLSYSVTVRRGSEVLYQQQVPLHYRSSTWTAVIPLGHEPAAEALPVLSRLVGSGAFPPLKDHGRVHIREYDFPAGPILPGTHEPLTPFMPTGGTRDEIGLVTNWAAGWALTGKPQARAQMLRVADIGLTIPWSFNEDGTGLPVRLDKRPHFWPTGDGKNWVKPPLPDSLFAGSTGGWEPDIAHKGALAYPAYLVTGEPVYLRALRHEASYGVTRVYVETRGKKGLYVTRDGQLRVVAWGLRSLGNAAWILPDNDPMKAYFTMLRDVNIAELHERFIENGLMDEAGDLEGYLETDKIYGENYTFMLWQNDYVVLTLAQEAFRGSPKAREVLDWAANFVIGRVLNIDDPTVYAAQDFNPGTLDGRRTGSWDVAVQTTKTTLPGRQFYPGDAGGGYSGLRAALGAIYHATGNPQALEALKKIHRETDDSLLYSDQNTGGRRWMVNYTLDPELD